jgi:hypothetical protein
MRREQVARLCRVGSCGGAQAFLVTVRQAAANNPGVPPARAMQPRSPIRVLGGVDAVVIGTRPALAEDTMRECAELGAKEV